MEREREKEKGMNMEGGSEGIQFTREHVPQSVRHQYSNIAHSTLRYLRGSDLGSCNPDNPVLPVRVLTQLIFICTFLNVLIILRFIDLKLYGLPCLSST